MQICRRVVQSAALEERMKRSSGVLVGCTKIAKQGIVSVFTLVTMLSSLAAQASPSSRVRGESDARTTAPSASVPSGPIDDDAPQATGPAGGQYDYPASLNGRLELGERFWKFGIGLGTPAAIAGAIFFAKVLGLGLLMGTG